jgi:2-C-methyl-D-erythritol 4-phosphate cytidylyltransferase
MKNFLIVLGMTSAFLISTVSADALKNSLTNILNTKDSSGMVNLNGISVGAKPKRKVIRQARKSRPASAVIGRYNDGKPVHKREANKYITKATKGKIKDLDLLPKKQRLMVLKDLQRMYAIKHFKSRPAKAVVATVNGQEIHKKSADNYLKLVTRGKVTDFDKLDKKQRLVLIKELARPMVLQADIDQNLTEEEKEAVLSQAWLQKQRAMTKVTNDQMLALYEAKKAKALAVNPQAQIPPYISLGENLKKEIIEKEIMANLMQDVDITVNFDSNKTVPNNETNESSAKLDKISNTKETK